MTTNRPLVEKADDVKSAVFIMDQAISMDEGQFGMTTLRGELEKIREQFAQPSIVQSAVYVSSKDFLRMGACALKTLKYNTHFSVAEFCLMLLHKHKLYGSSPIRSWGAIGVVMRIHSKVERFINLNSGNVKGGDETIEDTLTDILGYAVLGYRLTKEQE